MSISDLYTSGAHQRNLSHFANIVKLAVADNVITKEEQVLIDRLKTRLDITDSEYNKILENPSLYPINPPVSFEERVGRLFDLSRMVLADQQIVSSEILILERVIVGLGFESKYLSEIVDASFLLIRRFATIEEFTLAIKKVIKL